MSKLLNRPWVFCLLGLAVLMLKYREQSAYTRGYDAARVVYTARDDRARETLAEALLEGEAKLRRKEVLLEQQAKPRAGGDIDPWGKPRAGGEAATEMPPDAVALRVAAADAARVGGSSSRDWLRPNYEAAGGEPIRWPGKNRGKGKGGRAPAPQAGHVAVRDDIPLDHKDLDSQVWPRPDDVYITSFPKSGQTWIRFMLYNLQAYDSGEPADFDSIENRMPFLEDGTEGWIRWAFLSAPKPRIFKSHQPLLKPWPRYPCKAGLRQSKVQCLCPNCADRFKRVIYVLRDGRDVMYSYYRFRQGLGQLRGQSFTDFISPKKKHYPGPKWHEHVNGWMEAYRAQGEENGAASEDRDRRVLLVRYEDLKQNVSAVLVRMAKFIGLPHEPARLNWAVKMSDVDHMRQIESEKGPGFFEKKYKKVKKRKGKEFVFVRDAKAGGWADVFTRKDKAIFKAYAGETLIRLGYAKDNDW